MKRLLHSLHRLSWTSLSVDCSCLVACGRNDNVCSHLQFLLPWHLLSGINGGYYPAALQQAHSTTTHEAPHSAMPTSAAQSQAIALPVSAVTTAPPGLAHGLVSKSVSPYALPVVSSVTNLLPVIISAFERARRTESPQGRTIGSSLDVAEQSVKAARDNLRISIVSRYK